MVESTHAQIINYVFLEHHEWYIDFGYGPSSFFHTHIRKWNYYIMKPSIEVHMNTNKPKSSSTCQLLSNFSYILLCDGTLMAC